MLRIAETQGGPRSPGGARVSIVILLLMVGVAFCHGLATTHACAWPYDADAMRDTGIAQTLLDGEYPSDNLYAGEVNWFNPLTAGMVAVVSRLTGSTPMMVDARLGAYVNLLVPLSFSLLAVVLFDKWTALAASVLFLFGVPRDMPTWVSATYSPWLFASHFAQALFYLTLAAYVKVLRTRGYWRQIGVGVLLGLTFLAHTAPAILLGAIMLLTTAHRILSAKRTEGPPAAVRKTCAGLGVALLAAFLVSLPFSLPLLLRYRFMIANFHPSTWVWDYVSLANLPRFLREFFSLRSILAGVGLIALLLRANAPLKKRLVIYWLIAASAFFAYSYVWQYCARVDVRLPHVVPGYHFLLYLAALKNLLFGYGIVVCTRCVVPIARALAPNLGKWLSASKTRRMRCERAVLAVALLGVLGIVYPRYLGWREFHAVTDTETLGFSPEDNAEAYKWLVAHCAPSDVFLCNDRMSLFVVAPAARKVVATTPQFSNPYVNWDARFADRDAMFEALAENDRDRFQRLASQYGAKYILAEPKEREVVEQSSAARCERVFENDTLTVYSLSSSAPTTRNSTASP